MKHVKYSLVIGCLVALLACSPGGNKTIPVSDGKSADKQSPLADTTKMKADINNIVSSLTSEQPDTNKLKQAASDILSKDASILSDSGIDQLTGKDPSASQAGAI